MAENCLNCGNLNTENFCGNCGQKKYKRIDKKYIWDELQYTVFHTNKGLLYSVKKILKNPGYTAKEFIDGNRVNHYKPILLVFVLSGLSTFISFKILNLKDIFSKLYANQNLDSPFMADFLSFQASYNSILMLLFIPLFALTTKIAFRKWGHNYYEHVVMNAYILSFYTLISIIIFYPIMYFFRHSLSKLGVFMQVSTLLIPIIIVLFFKEFYKEKPLKLILLRALGVIGLIILGYMLLLIFGGIVAYIYTMLKGPEALEYLKPK